MELPTILLVVVAGGNAAGSNGIGGTDGSGGGGGGAGTGSAAGGSGLNTGANRGTGISANGGAGGANTGGGGGGSTHTEGTGGAGGSGIVIVRYLTYGTLYLGATNTSSADLAEYYVSGDKNIEAGDVVTIADTKIRLLRSDLSPDGEPASLLSRSDLAEEVTTQGVLRKATKPYDSKLIGIISTNPGVLMGSIDGETDKADKRMLALLRTGAGQD